jgi:two-component system cell cycle sensor histidine kinase PleC
MARSNAAESLSYGGTIEGIARPLVSENYLRMVATEPWLRRLVPVLIVLFLITVLAGTVVQILGSRSDAIKESMADLEFVAALAAADPTASATLTPSSPAASAQLPESRLLARGRQILFADENGAITGSRPALPQGITTTTDLLGDAQPLLILADRAGVMRFKLPDGTDTLATVRRLGGNRGTVVVVQNMEAALARWRQRAFALATLVGTTSLVIVTLGFAFFQQAARAREADFICKEVRARIDTVLRHGGSGLWDWDLARGRIYWSDSMYTMLGLERTGEFLSFGDMNRILHPEEDDLFELAKRMAGTKNGTIDHEFRAIHASGRIIWIRARGQVVHDRAGEGPHLVGIAVETTHEKLLAARRDTEELRLRDAVETITEAFILWDSDNRLVLSNSKFRELHKLPLEAVRPGTAYEDVHAQGTQPLIRTEIMVDECRNSGARSFEIELADGRWLLINERRTKDGGFVSVGTDITMRRRQEERLRDSEKRLIATVSDLRQSREALQAQARQVSDLADRYLEEKLKAEAANRAKSEFLANMSHELRTPLNHIIGFADLMTSGILGPLGAAKYTEYCKDIGDSGRYLLNVITGVLDMSRLEAGRVHLDKQPFDMSLLVEEVGAAIAPNAEAKNITLDIDDRVQVVINGDRQAVGQVLGNLMKNAVKFTPDGGKVRVSVRRSNDTVVVCVEDTGVGIPSHALEGVTLPFVQSSSALHDGYKGTGLGLAIARSLVELHGGVLSVRSHQGEGTTVRFQLPTDQGRSLKPLAPNSELSGSPIKMEHRGAARLH